MLNTKPRNKVVGASSRAGFKRRPNQETGSNFSSRTQQSLNYQGRRKTYSSRASQFQKNIKSRGNYYWFLPKLKTYLRKKIKTSNVGTSSNVEEWENITLDFEEEPPNQKTKVMSGQVSQKVMVEINIRIGKGVIKYTEHEKGEFISPILFVQSLMEPAN